ncbi:MAG: hypothetical protein AAGE59_15335 [Cyanobacteria bacterium P01_F01_bin.86]
MAHPTILQAGSRYSFRSYFELPYDTDEVLAEFGYRFQRAYLDLPHSQVAMPQLSGLKQQLEEVIPYVTLSSEAAKREALVAPILMRVAIACQTLLRIEYSLTVDEYLQGTLDYFMQSEKGLVVVEAKRDDLTRGFTQLGVEMIALAKLNPELELIYGAVTIGELWVFGTLNQVKKLILRDIQSFKVPEDVEALTQVLVGILQEKL